MEPSIRLINSHIIKTEIDFESPGSQKDLWDSHVTHALKLKVVQVLRGEARRVPREGGERRATPTRTAASSDEAEVAGGDPEVGRGGQEGRAGVSGVHLPEPSQSGPQEAAGRHAEGEEAHEGDAAESHLPLPPGRERAARGEVASAVRGDFQNSQQQI